MSRGRMIPKACQLSGLALGGRAALRSSVYQQLQLLQQPAEPTAAATTATTAATAAEQQTIYPSLSSGNVEKRAP